MYLLKKQNGFKILFEYGLLCIVLVKPKIATRYVDLTTNTLEMFCYHREREKYITRFSEIKSTIETRGKKVK